MCFFTQNDGSVAFFCAHKYFTMRSLTSYYPTKRCQTAMSRNEAHLVLKPLPQIHVRFSASMSKSAFLELTDKFNLTKEDFFDFLVSENEMGVGTAKNLVKRIWDGYLPPRGLQRLADFLSQSIPYGLPPRMFQAHLRTRMTQSCTKTDLDAEIGKLEGVYEMSRFHSEIEGLILEYITLYGGRAGYSNYSIGANNAVFETKMSIVQNHLLFRCDAQSGRVGLFAVVEFHNFGRNSFAGMILGLDDSADEMICCDVIIRKISHRASNWKDFGERRPEVASKPNPRVLKALLPKERTVIFPSNVHRFSGKIMRAMLRNQQRENTF